MFYFPVLKAYEWSPYRWLFKARSLLQYIFVLGFVPQRRTLWSDCEAKWRRKFLAPL